MRYGRFDDEAREYIIDNVDTPLPVSYTPLKLPTLYSLYNPRVVVSINNK